MSKRRTAEFVCQQGTRYQGCSICHLSLRHSHEAAASHLGESDEDKHAFNQVKRKAHAAFASSVPQGEHRVLQDAGHLFYTQRPDVVVDAVFDILDRLASR